jgi:hypothetical protein
MQRNFDLTQPFAAGMRVHAYVIGWTRWCLSLSVRLCSSVYRLLTVCFWNSDLYIRTVAGCEEEGCAS